MIRVQVFHSILEIAPPDWETLSPRDFPFSGYHFLAALETGECVGQRTGWWPHFVTAWEGTQLLGAVVLYLKTNSYGEYIFDFAWAQAYQHSGLAYYPKLTSAIPFTPATGPKFLWRLDLQDEIRNRVCAELMAAVDRLAIDLKVSSLHALFIPKEQLQRYSTAGYFLRDSFQFHWHNQGYTNFAAFTASLTSKRRREILRERAQVSAAPVRLVRLTGDAIGAHHAEIFYKFYLATIDKRNSYDYLTLAFFKAVFTHMKDYVLLVLAIDAEDRPVAGALNYFGQHTLYGRNWGCVEEYKSLHFELCYYQGIEFAIERKLQRFEAGAQGEHKFQRGFLPSLTYSAHKIYDPALDRAIQDHVGFEREQISQALREYFEHTPFARSSTD